MNNKYRKFFNNYFRKKPFSISIKEKGKFFLEGLSILNSLHYKNNKTYKIIIDRIGSLKKETLESLPFLPVSIFKDIDLLTSKRNNITTIATSSGTSSSRVSKIFLDKENSINQYRVLQKILFDFFGNRKFPMLFLSKNTSKMSTINAKVAGINGFSSLASKKFYLIDNNNKINLDSLNEFLKIADQKIFFGFTFEIYDYFFKNKIKGDFKNTILIHGGGWKKLEKLKISNNKFESYLKNNFKFKEVINYYGMIEQTGSIFFECPRCKTFICSIFSEIFIRDKNFKVVKNKPGLIQLMSLLPISYPGHNIITQDMGIVLNKKCKQCKDKVGKRFKILGRVKDADMRGCSNI